MAAGNGMIDSWVDELTKLRKNVAAKKPFFVNPKVIANASTHRKKESEFSGKSDYSIKKEDDQTLSESTICLLLDRFVPC